MNSKSDQGFEVIVSHPARQGFVYECPLAAQRHGIPVKFLTGLYYKPDKFPYFLARFLPPLTRAKFVRQLNKRRLADLNSDEVISLGGPWLEATLRPLSWISVWWKAHDWLASRWLRRANLGEKPILLHCFDGAAKRTIEVAKQRGITTVLEITLPMIAADLVQEEKQRLGFSETKYHSWWLSSEWKNRIRQECQSADYVIAQSRLTVNHLLNIGIPPHRIVLMPLGVDIEHFHPRRRNTSEPFRVLFVGQIGIRKGVHHLLRAWDDLGLPNAELLLAGAINANECGNELLDGHRGIYRHLGFLDGEALINAYQQSDVFVLPSLAEGAALVMHEAMASGLPCIVSENVGCTLRNGVEGFVVPVGDVRALKERILQLYNTPDLRRQMGQAARARAEKLSWENYGHRLVLTYRFLLSGKQRLSTQILDMTQM
jgi:glycosyltransferase involved in cell wall biosynthesis